MQGIMLVGHDNMLSTRALTIWLNIFIDNDDQYMIGPKFSEDVKEYKTCLLLKL